MTMKGTNMEFSAIEQRLLDEGVAQIGYADLHGVVPKRYTHLPYGISLVWRLCDGILDEVAANLAPSFTYFQHYRAVNAALDSKNLWLAAMIERHGYHAMPIGASQSVHDMGPYSGAFQHKTVAVRAGLGWIGKSALFISPQFGPRVRLASLLTDMPLPTPRQEALTLNSSCGSCHICADRCPAHAITGAAYQDGMERSSLFDAKACSEHMKKAYQNIGRGAVCGICVSVCPYGKPKPKMDLDL